MSRYITTQEAYPEDFEKCESPIETRLLQSLIPMAEQLETDLGGKDKLSMVMVNPQVGKNCGGKNYRIDFMIGVCFGTRQFFVAVECDGHDYHERTKEQAARDRSRDRAMQISGLIVLRFTGSEIHHDADACSLEVRSAIINKLGLEDSIG